MLMEVKKDYKNAIISQVRMYVCTCVKRSIQKFNGTLANGQQQRARAIMPRGAQGQEAWLTKAEVRVNFAPARCIYYFIDR